MKIVYSLGKRGYEAQQWEKEIRASSTASAEFIPFNHDNYIPYEATTDAVQLDRLYQTRDSRIDRLHRALLELVERTQPDVLFVTNSPPYHPEFLRRLGLYKVLYSTDDPGATYQRTIPYVHAYDHLMYCAPGYSADCDLGEKLRYAGARRADWLPLGVFDFEMDASASAETSRDIDVVYVGACYRQKLPLIAAMKRVFGRRVKIHGYFSAIKNAYMVLRHGYMGWIRPVSFAERTAMYRRSKIGFNIHWNGWGLGNQRLYHLPANAAMQICDCPQLVHHVYQPDREIVSYSNIEELIDRTRYYLQHDSERVAIAAAGHARVLRQYGLQSVNKRIVELVSSDSRFSREALQRHVQ
jgi:spore maturation protein CgeB